jgi:mycothiol synthase
MRLRAPVPDDAPAALAVLVAREVADLGVPDYTLEDLLDEWRGSDLVLAADARVVEVDGRIVAYGAVRRPGTLAVVSPEFEGRGIGARLLQWAETRERARGSERHRQWIAAGNARAQALLRAAGYARARSYSRMVCQLDEIAPADRPPSGVGLRPLDVDADADAVYALDAISFAAAPDHQSMSLAEFCEEHLGAHDVDPELSSVAELGEDPVGFLLARRWKDEAVGYVDILAVHPEQQHRGLGTALLREAFARFAAAGLKQAQLGVASDNPRALRLYERVGMKQRFRFDTYERPILIERRGPH